MSDVYARPRRSLLFVPGDNKHMILKSTRLDADLVILDLEDAVTPERKTMARELVMSSLRELRWPGEIGVRINALDTEVSKNDVAALEGCSLSIVVVPKVESASSIAQLHRELSDVPLIPTLETARGVLRAEEVAGAEGVVGILFGAMDLLAETGGVPTLTMRELDVPRMHIVLAATATGIDAYDLGFTQAIDNLDALKEDALVGRRMGYKGKAVIHPTQIPIVNRVFSPSAEEIIAAQRIVKAFSKASAEGTGALRVEGDLVDLPMVARARRVLASAAMFSGENDK